MTSELVGFYSAFELGFLKADAPHLRPPEDREVTGKRGMASH